MSEKDKAKELIFHHWFHMYGNLMQMSKEKALDQVERLIIHDPDRAAYWLKVKDEILAF